MSANCSTKAIILFTILLAHLILFLFYNMVLEGPNAQAILKVILSNSFPLSDINDTVDQPDVLFIDPFQISESNSTDATNIPYNIFNSNFPASNSEFSTDTNSTSIPTIFAVSYPPKDFCGYLIRGPPDGRLGNQMFSYASFYGIVKQQQSYAKKKSFIRIWGRPFELDLAFENLSIPRTVMPDEWFSDRNFNTMSERTCCSFDESLLDNLKCDRKNFTVAGYMQSYKYFIDHTDEIKKEFVFRSDVKKECQNLFDKSLNQKGLDLKKCIKVGIHLRRGDFTLPHKIEFGHSPAHSNYVKDVVKFHEIRTLGNRSDSNCLVFLLFGNDLQWNKNVSKEVELLFPNRTHFVLIDPDKSSPQVDLCALSLCDHVAMSTGSFGWWAAFLNNGITTYQKEYARDGSYHMSEYQKKDYFLPGWIAL